MSRELDTIRTLIELKDHLEVGFQLDGSFQRVYAYIKDKELTKKIEAEGKAYGTFSIELFGRRRDDDEEAYDIFAHLHFLRHVGRYEMKHWSSNGRITDIGMGAVILFQDKKFFEKFCAAISKATNQWRIRALDEIGGAPTDYKLGDFAQQIEAKIKDYKDGIERLQKNKSEYVPTSEKHLALEAEIKEKQELLEVLITPFQ